MEEIKDNFRQLNPTRSVYSVLGNLCANPRALRDPDVHLSEEDFKQDFHKIIFVAINNIVFSGVEITESFKITEIDIDNALSVNDAGYALWSDNEGITYMKKAIEFSNIDTFRYNYDILKKFTLLRDYTEQGISIAELFDNESNDMITYTKGVKKIETMKLEDIVEHFSLKMTSLRNKWSISKNSKNFTAGDDLESLLDEMDEEPEFGHPFQNGYYNSIFRGMRPGKFMLRSAATGGGKTRQSLADMCSISCDEIYDLKFGWKKNGTSIPTLFISTELEKRELQTAMLAFISGIDEDIIKAGKFSPEIRTHLNYAVQVLKRAPIFAVYVDDFSIADIEGIIEQHVIEKNVQFVAFDYIQMTGKLSRSMQTAFGASLREDQILVQFSGAMKLLANKYQIYIISSTQLNRNHKDPNNRDTQSLRGGSATADKVDHGIMTFPVIAEDKTNLEHLLTNGYEEPNFSHWVYKNRSGRTAVIIWTKMDLGTMREEVLFMTTYDYQLVTNIKPRNVDVNEMYKEYEQTDVEEFNLNF